MQELGIVKGRKNKELSKWSEINNKKMNSERFCAGVSKLVAACQEIIYSNQKEQQKEGAICKA